jgi:hypothetical protein
MKKSYHSKHLAKIIGKCEIEECHETLNLEKHHIIPQKDKKKNKDFSHGFVNLAILCPNHHAMADSGDLIIEGRFSSTRGSVLLYHFKK